MAVLAPMPSARETTATAVTTGEARNARAARRRSCTRPPRQLSFRKSGGSSLAAPRGPGNKVNAALVRTATGYALRATTFTVKTVRDEIVDGENERTGKEVTVSDARQPLFLVKAGRPPAPARRADCVRWRVTPRAGLADPAREPGRRASADRRQRSHGAAAAARHPGPALRADASRWRHRPDAVLR